ncbi:MAG: nucleotide exchange factor GrpE [Candidatus Gracilibacteria bacterium]|nr:nucleotide exchange factor GrpE [Candidatus Gracilibacteria bacterium]MDD2909123.1 nucleotide exchange factor GrpE [Candidatus Gracilibacteria bacterium]
MTTQETNNDENINQDEILDMENILEGDIAEAEKAEEIIEGEIKELGKISEEITNLKDALARAQADYQNLIRRVERDREEMGTYFTSSIVLKFLPSIDNLERIINSTPESEQSGAVYEGVKSIYAGLNKTLENLNIKNFISLGKEVDPNFHDVMTQLPGEEGIIIQEFEKGYLIGEKVLRHAKVVAGNGE